MRKYSAYEFAFLGGIDNTYIFPTRHNLTYEVRFKPSGYIFGNENLFADLVFELVVLPIKSDAEKEKPLDSRLPATIAAIVRDFFIQKEKVLLYICENRDGKGAIRDRKFRRWFDFYNMQDHFKVDLEIGNAQEKYFTSLIGKLDNPHKAELVVAYFELIEKHDK